MNTTKQEHPEMIELAEQHKAECESLNDNEREKVREVVEETCMTMLFGMSDKAARMALKHITETFNTCSK